MNHQFSSLYMPDYADIARPEEREAMSAWPTAVPAPHGGYCLQGFDEPEEAVGGGIKTSQGYNSGLYLSIHQHGKGRIILSCLDIIPNLGKDPVADRLLRNLINYAESVAQ